MVCALLGMPAEGLTGSRARSEIFSLCGGGDASAISTTQ
jgi:hypothetical protein